MYIAGLFFPTLSLVFLGLAFLFGFILIITVFADAMVPPIMPHMFSSVEFHKRELKHMQDAFNTKVFLGMAGVVFAILAVVTVLTV